MRVLVVGCGNIGSAAADDLAKNTSHEVTVADNDRTRAKIVAENIGTDNTSWIQLDVANHDQLIQTLRSFDLVMGFLPGKLGNRFIEACIDAEKDLVDVSYMAENPLALNERAKKAGVAIVPDCGLAPGISNVLVGHATKQMNKINAIHLMVGGLPEKPVPPLGYTITWSPESLIDEYTRKAGIVKEGVKKEIEALSGLEEIEIPKVGKLEAFYTDGLRTLLYTITGVDDMWEKTLRYPGHVEKIKTLKTLGLFDEKQVDVGGLKVAPRKLTAKLLGQKLRMPKVKDIVVLEVNVQGIKNGRKTVLSYHILDYFDRKRGITAMARTTAYPASIIAQLMLKKSIRETGIVAPERIGMKEELFDTFINELGKRGIRVVEETTID